ncbi:TetR/AcrR family transcriptional regulator [Pseudonocardia sp. HH130630-07]|uniref:TetR/AcrR family transcriptional regulator n=1 Tax=Pseudonocardia sp. HH130630-07 TaxID=1690815 RepID=UPI000814B87F|nr:TetR/AcrR family transcriptional regulator [Pseudonocardia sp. HH130630-07]ANY07765.1 hypothetical protein AFB00_17335 [Pseudonocardia sp. HH130630-07]
MHRNESDGVRQPARRGRPRERRADDAILDAALTLFADGGLAATTFDGVATHAGVSRSTLYRRWSTRDDLLIAALQWSRARAEAGVEDWATRSHADQMAIFTRLAVRGLTDAGGIGLLRHVTALPGDSPVRHAYWSTIVAPRRDVFTQLLVSARAAGDLPQGPAPDLLLDQLAGALTYRALVHPTPLDKDTAEHYLRRLLTSLGLASTHDDRSTGPHP